MRQTIMFRLLPVVLFVLLAGPAAAQRSGLYTVQGLNMDGTSYDGTADLEQIGSASFTIVWRVGGRLIQGVGMVAGHSFAVVYGASNQPGMGIYTLQPDGRLVGTWTVVGAAGTGSEVMTPSVAGQESPPAVVAPSRP